MCTSIKRETTAEGTFARAQAIELDYGTSDWNTYRGIERGTEGVAYIQQYAPEDAKVHLLGRFAIWMGNGAKMEDAAPMAVDILLAETFRNDLRAQARQLRQ